MSRLRGHAVLIGALVVSVLLLGPALGPGYTLTVDMVFVPRQSLLPPSLGLGDVLPRAVPQDAVLAALTAIAPGAVWQHLMLVGVVAGSFIGVARLLARGPVWQQLMGGVLYAWSPFVAERLVLGSWPLLVAYAVLPWVLGQALLARRSRPGAGSRVVLLVALASLAPFGGLLAMAVALPVALGPGSALERHRRWAVAAASAAAQLPWLVPALVSPARWMADPAGATVFALRPEGPWGALLTALGTGGAWNADVVPESRAAGLGVVGTLAVTALAIGGARGVRAVLGRSGAATLGALAGLGLLIAVGGAMAPALAEAIGLLPGGGLVRDGQRALAPLALLLAVAAPLGAARLVRRVGDPLGMRVLVAALVAIPVLTMPDAAWGGLGRLSAVEYPDDWRRTREAVQDLQTPGDVVVLPWGAFRAFAWNAGRPVLDPAPRWLPRPSVVDDTLPVRRASGEVVRVSGESARAAEVARALERGEPLIPTMRAIGAGLVLVERGTPGVVSPVALEGLEVVLSTPGLDLYAVPGGVAPPTPSPGRVAAVGAAWFAALIALIGAAIAAARGRRRFAAPNGVRGGTVRAPEVEEGS